MKSHLDSFKKEAQYIPPMNSHFQKMLYFSNNEDKSFPQNVQVILTLIIDL